jgi:hypothetical protein
MDTVCFIGIGQGQYDGRNDSSNVYLWENFGVVSTATPAMDVVYKVYQVLQDDRVSLRDFINRHKQSG